MDIRHLRQVLAIHRYGSIAKASEVLGLSQPSLSVSLARLEDELGSRVFERSAAGSKATAVGEALLARAEQLIAEVDGLTRHAALVGCGDTVQLRLGISFGLGPLLLPSLIVRIAQSQPDLRLHIETASGIDLYAKFERHELDLILCGDRPEIHKSDIALSEAGRTRIVAIAAPGHDLQDQKAIDPRTLSKFKNVGSLSPTYTASSFFNFENIWYVPTVVTNDPWTFPAFVEAGYIVVAAEIFVRDIILRREAVELDLDRESYLPIYAVSKESTRKSPVIASVSRAIVELFRSACEADASSSFIRAGAHAAKMV